MPLLTKIAKPEQFVPETLARAIYESAPILHRTINVFLEWEVMSPAYRQAKMGEAEQLRSNLVQRGITSTSRIILDCNRFTAAEWAACWRYATRASDELATVQASVTLMQHALERLVAKGIIQ